MADTLEARLVRALLARRWRLACAESLTGGAFGARLTRVPGAGDVFVGGVVGYTDAAKTALLRVDSDLLRRRGAVSPEVAEAMAEGARKALDADLAVSLTGFAGPDAPGRGPVGLVYVGLARPEAPPRATEHRFEGDREAVRAQAVEAALRLALAATEGGT